MSVGRRIGILGGTFDPVHIGHIFAAEAARDAYALDYVLFIPAGDPPHKKNIRLAPGKDRIEMLRRAAEHNPFFKVDPREVERKGTTYTIDTLRELREEYPGNELFFIIGGDTLLELKNWREFNSVAKLCRFIVYERPGVAMDEQLKEANWLEETFNAVIHFLEGPHLEVSSKLIRKRLKNNQTIRYLVPEEVYKYIIEHNLYKG
jgi:nicotinate-nucleotide adenylyltransferase